MLGAANIISLIDLNKSFKTIFRVRTYLYTTILYLPYINVIHKHKHKHFIHKQNTIYYALYIFTITLHVLCLVSRLENQLIDIKTYIYIA